MSNALDETTLMMFMRDSFKTARQSIDELERKMELLFRLKTSPAVATTAGDVDNKTCPLPLAKPPQTAYAAGVVDWRQRFPDMKWAPATADVKDSTVDITPDLDELTVPIKPLEEPRPTVTTSVLDIPSGRITTTVEPAATAPPTPAMATPVPNGNMSVIDMLTAAAATPVDAAELAAEENEEESIAEETKEETTAEEDDAEGVAKAMDIDGHMYFVCEQEGVTRIYAHISDEEAGAEIGFVNDEGEADFNKLVEWKSGGQTYWVARETPFVIYKYLPNGQPGEALGLRVNNRPVWNS